MRDKSKITFQFSKFFTKRRLLLWGVALFVFYLFNLLISAFSEYENESLLFIIQDQIIVLFMCISICEISIFIDKILNKRLDWTERPVKRLIIQFFLQISASILFVAIVTFFFLKYFETDAETYFSKEYLWITQSMATNIVLSIVISAISTGDFLLNNWKVSIMKANEQQLKLSQLQQAKLQAELQAMKLQIDPHFIFNNLSVLSELILKDQQLGYDYAENFSLVYKYLLVHSKKDIITLKEELSFLESYIFLIKKRIEGGISFHISVEEQHKSKLIPPLTLQLLVENAIKHNKTERSNPLRITIESTEDDYLIISNTFLPINEVVHSSGIGMPNIITRYELLSKKKPIIHRTAAIYSVKIPLL